MEYVKKIKPLPHIEYIVEKLENDKKLDEFQLIYPDQIIQEAYKAMVKRYDDFVFEQFKKCGYSRDEVLRLAEEERLMGMGCGTHDISYYLDGELLFRIERVYIPHFKNSDTYFGYDVRVICMFADGATVVMEEE